MNNEERKNQKETKAVFWAFGLIILLSIVAMIWFVLATV